jgi:signal transduction histidine kinase
MLRSLAGRVTLIVLTGMMVAWLGLVALFYGSQRLNKEGERPSPDQLWALVELLEGAPEQVRPLVLETVKSSALDARLENAETFDTQSKGVSNITSSQWTDYSRALGGRRFSIQQRSPSGMGLLTRLFEGSSELQFRVALKTSEILVVDARTPVVVTRFGFPIGFGAGLFGTLVAFTTLVAMNRETRPLAQLAETIDHLTPGGETLPPPRARTREIKAVVEAFNRLQDRLAHLLRARMAMLGGISHDVRTFATRLRLRVDLIPEGMEREHAISDISDMIRLLDDALLASRATGVGALSEELVEFDEIVLDEVKDRKVAGSPVDLYLGPNTIGVMVLGDRLAIRRIISNLIENAVKYGRSAHVSIQSEEQSLILTVDDEGKGIPANLRKILLEPFVRLETSRNRRTGGAGLGLAIVRNLVEAHGGIVTIDDAPTGGARFIVRLPTFATV